MPRPSIGARAKPSSNSPAEPPRKAAPPSPHFTESQQSPPPNGQDQSENRPNSSDWLSLDAIEPFPPSLFRVPVPDRVFAKMSGLSDAALRCLLGLIHRSWRFDPEKGSWIHSEKWHTRADVQEETGLSDQGTRGGLSDLEKKSWAEVDRSGRSYRYRLRMEVPTQRYTYLPTTLFEKVRGMDSTTALRVLLAIFRKTWGWTDVETDPETGGSQAVHKRWARASKADLAAITGHSDTAIGQAIGSLEGTWLNRSRPDAGAHLYRVLPEKLGPKEEKGREEEPSNPPTANAVTPHRQQSYLPTSYKESSFRDKQSSQEEEEPPARSYQGNPTGRRDAVPKEDPRSGTPPDSQEESPRNSGPDPLPSFSDLSPKKQSLGQKLINAGVWPDRAKECLSRYSEQRIEANFELYRQRAPEIDDDGAWLCAAITDGYADLESSPPRAHAGDDDSTSERAGPLPPLDHKETLSEAKKDAYVAQGIDEDRFHRCPPSQHRPDETRFMYFDPEIGEPTRRGVPDPA